ncbi:MAG: ABC transporter permease [Bacteroidetes bacterium]|nr:MAG: ABC transporter permease [Bacteroidota bacterium]
MIKNYLLLAFRNMKRQPTLTFINVLGLAFGMAATIILTLFVKHERSFENMHDNAPRVYRLITKFHGHFDYTIPFTLALTGPGLAENIPEVESFSRILSRHTTLEKDDKHFTNIRAFYVDSCFSDIFSFPVLEGNPKNSLNNPSHIILTRKIAENLFPDGSAVGQVLEMDVLRMNIERDQHETRRMPFVVGAVIEDPPTHTHLQFEVLVPLLVIPDEEQNQLMNFFATYLLLNTPPDKEVEEKIATLATALVLDVFGNYLQASIHLQGLQNIHFGQHLDSDLSPKGNYQNILIMTGLAIFILTIAIFNFINLITAQADKRIIETGIRKVAGAQKKNIVYQFLGESVLVAFIALVISLILVEVFLPPFAALLERDLALNAFFSFSFIASLFLLALCVGLIAGLYPAFSFAGHQPVEILKGQLNLGNRTPFLRIALVVSQFVIVVFLIVFLWVVNNQIRYMKHDNLGFDKENVLLFRGLTPGIKSSYPAIKHELLQLPEVSAVTASQAVPGVGGSSQVFRRRDQSIEEAIPIIYFATIDEFIDFYDIPLLAGRWLDERIQTDNYEYVVNQETVRRLGLKDPIGADVALWEYHGKIIGVVEDFHFQSLHEPIGALVFNRYFDEIRIISVKVNSNNLPAARERIEQVFMKSDNAYGVNSGWLDDIYSQSYRFEDRSFSIILYASSVAIIIALLGLYGLSSYMILSRRREISLRKVLGATLMQIMLVFFKVILKWILIAIVIAWPLAWLAANRWLDNFAYQIDLAPFFFLMSALVTLLIATLTIVYQTFRAARQSPVEAMKR